MPSLLPFCLFRSPRLVYWYLDDMDLYTSVIINALDECERQGAHIVNMSFGAGTFNNQMRLKVEEKIANGMILIAAAGNDGEDTNGVLYPAGSGGQDSAT